MTVDRIMIGSDGAMEKYSRGLENGLTGQITVVVGVTPWSCWLGTLSCQALEMGLRLSDSLAPHAGILIIGRVFWTPSVGAVGG